MTEEFDPFSQDVPRNCAIRIKLDTTPPVGTSVKSLTKETCVETEKDNMTRSLMESLLDVPDYMLERYVATSQSGYVSKMCEEILNARKVASAFLEAFETTDSLSEPEKS